MNLATAPGILRRSLPESGEPLTNANFSMLKIYVSNLETKIFPRIEAGAYSDYYDPALPPLRTA
jgi:hypothetical protein